MPNFRLIPDRKIVLLMPKVEVCENCGEIQVAQKCKMQKGCSMSSIGKANSLFGFNDGTSL